MEHEREVVIEIWENDGKIEFFHGKNKIRSIDARLGADKMLEVVVSIADYFNNTQGIGCVFAMK